MMIIDELTIACLNLLALAQKLRTEHQQEARILVLSAADFLAEARAIVQGDCREVGRKKDIGSCANYGHGQDDYDQWD